jgi:multicomponent Na+:H+ antiporter subunit C
MEILLALASGVLYATGIYMMLRRRLAQLIIGIGLLSNGTSLLIFTAGGLTRARPRSFPLAHRRSYSRTPTRFPRRSSSPRS